MEQGMIRLPIGDNPWFRGWNDLDRRLFIKGIGIACLGMVPFLYGCDSAFSREGKGNGPAGAGGVPRAARPPIDTAVPVETRTATFALG